MFYVRKRKYRCPPQREINPRREAVKKILLLSAGNPLAAAFGLATLPISKRGEAAENAAANYLGVVTLSNAVKTLIKPEDASGELEDLRQKLEKMDRTDIAKFLKAKHNAGDTRTINLASLLIDESNPENLGVFNAVLEMHPEPFVSNERKVFDGVVIFYQNLIAEARNMVVIADTSMQSIATDKLRSKAKETVNNVFDYWLNMFQNNRPLAAAAILTSGLRNAEVRALLSPLNSANFDQNLVRQIFASVAAYRALMPAVAADEKFGDAFADIVRTFKETLFLRMLGDLDKNKLLEAFCGSEKEPNTGIAGSDRVSRLDEYIRKKMLTKAMSGSLYLERLPVGETKIIGYSEGSISDLKNDHAVDLGTVLRELNGEAVFEVGSMSSDGTIVVRVRLPDDKFPTSPKSGLLGWWPFESDSNGPTGKNYIENLQRIMKDGWLKLKIDKPERLLFYLAQPSDQDGNKGIATTLPPVGLLWLYAQMCKSGNQFRLDDDILENGKTKIPNFRYIHPETIINNNDGMAKIALSLSGDSSKPGSDFSAQEYRGESTVSVDNFVQAISTQDFNWQNLALAVAFQAASEVGLIKKLVEYAPEIAKASWVIAVEVSSFTLRATQGGAQFLIAEGPEIALGIAKGTLKYSMKGLKLGAKGLKTSVKVAEAPFKLFKEAVEVVDKYKDTPWMANMIEWFSRGTGRWGPPFSHLKAPHPNTAPAEIDTSGLVQLFKNQSNLFSI